MRERQETVEKIPVKPGLELVARLMVGERAADTWVFRVANITDGVVQLEDTAATTRKYNFPLEAVERGRFNQVALSVPAGSERFNGS